MSYRDYQQSGHYVAQHLESAGISQLYQNVMIGDIPLPAEFNSEQPPEIVTEAPKKTTRKRTTNPKA
jgi:hypothetical protein